MTIKVTTRRFSLRKGKGPPTDERNTYTFSICLLTGSGETKVLPELSVTDFYPVASQVIRRQAKAELKINPGYVHAIVYLI